MSLPEVLLWRFLRNRPGGFKARRQHPVGPYVVDFYLPAAKLAVEIDGIAHDLGDRPQSDVQRDAWLKLQGLTILRIDAKEVLADPEAAADHIIRFCAAK